MARAVLASLLIVSAASVSSQEFRFVQGSGYLDLLHGDKPVYRHVTAWDPKSHSTTFKTFHHVYGFHGEGTLTKGPGGQFTHHRGLFLGWSKTATAGKEMDSWHGGNGSSTRHVRYLDDRELAGATARRASVTEWTMGDNSVIVRDTREVTASFPAPGRLQLDWAITLASATGEPVTLDGDPQHAGFQFRADSTITAFAYLGPADKTGTGDVWTMKPANSWAVNSFSLKDHGYAVMQLDHPSNPRPVQVSHRDYGRFGHFFVTTIPADKPLTIHFRTLVIDTDRHGPMNQVSAQALYDEFARWNPQTGSAVRGRPLLRAEGNRRATLRLLPGSHPWEVGLDGGLRVPAQVFGIEGRRLAPGAVAPALLLQKP